MFWVGTRDLSSRDSGSAVDGLSAPSDTFEMSTFTDSTKLRNLSFDTNNEDDAGVNKTRRKVFLAVLSLSFLWTGSQIPIYMLLSVEPYIVADINGGDRSTWFTLGPTVALAAVCPFVGGIADLIGRRWSTLFGACCLVIGLGIAGLAQNANALIAGAAILGVGAGLCELNALAGTSEIAPNKDRGKYAAMLIFSILPFIPLTLYAQNVAAYATWRWTCWISLIWVGIGLVMTYFFYDPPPRINSEGLTKRQIIKRMDYIGGLLSLVGLVMFMLGLVWGGYQYPWLSVPVLFPMIFGLCTLAAFVVWEVKFAAYPLFPGELFQHPRVFTLTMIITAISGANFFSLLSLWPTYTYNVFSRDPQSVGVMGLSQVVGTLCGAAMVTAMLSYLKGRVRPLIVIAACLMTGGIGALAAADSYSPIFANIMVVIGCLGVGGIVVPASVITALVSPDELIGTVTAMTLTIRVIGGSVGYAIYYNRLHGSMIRELAKKSVLLPLVEAGIPAADLRKFIEAYMSQNAASFRPLIDASPELYTTEKLAAFVELLYQVLKPAWVSAFREVWLITIVFGISAVGCALCLGDVKRYMSTHTAVVL